MKFESFKIRTLAATLMMCASALSLSANATVVNVAALNPSNANLSPAPAVLSLGAGTYQVSVVGIAGGGIYDAWSARTNNGTPSGWRDAFTITIGGTSFVYDIASGSYYSEYGSASAALSAFTTGSYVQVAGNTTVAKPNGVTFTLASATDVFFSVPDNQWWDNAGGVSLSVTNAVPEPGTISIMLAGLGLIGLTRKRRKQKAA